MNDFTKEDLEYLDFCLVRISMLNRDMKNVHPVHMKIINILALWDERDICQVIKEDTDHLNKLGIYFKGKLNE